MKITIKDSIAMVITELETKYLHNFESIATTDDNGDETYRITIDLTNNSPTCSKYGARLNHIVDGKYAFKIDLDPRTEVETQKKHIAEMLVGKVEPLEKAVAEINKMYKKLETEHEQLLNKIEVQ